MEHIPIEVEMYSGELITIEELFRLKDDSLLHLGYCSSADQHDLFRLTELELLIYEKFEKRIQTVVVFGPTIEEAELFLDLAAV